MADPPIAPSMALATAMSTLSRVFHKDLFIGFEMLKLKYSGTFGAHIERPPLLYLTHDGFFSAFHAAHGCHQRSHVFGVVGIERLVCVESGEGTDLTDVVVRVVAVGGRSPAGNNAADGVASVFVAISAQQDKYF